MDHSSKSRLWEELIASGHEARRRHDFQEAERKFVSGLNVAMEFGGCDHRTLECLETLGALYRDLKEFDKSIGCFSQAVEICKKLRGNDSYQVSLNLNRLARVCRDAGRYMEAEANYVCALQIRKLCAGEFRPTIDLIEHNLEHFKREKAEKLYASSQQKRPG